MQVSFCFGLIFCLKKYLYRVIDESGEDYLYELEDKTKFKIIEE